MITTEQERALAELWATSHGHYMQKFALTPHSWYADAVDIAKTAGLHESPPLRILDLGCGFGYFQLACRQFGHTFEGLDVYDPVLSLATSILGAPYVPHTILSYEPLPGELTDYDLITTFGVNFRLTPKLYWGLAEYGFLTSDVRKRLRPGGRWLLRPNQASDATPPIASLMDPAWWQGIIGREATVSISSHEVDIRWH